MGLLDGRTGLVTGGAPGLGAAVARLAAAEGSRILVADVREERGRAVVVEIGSAAAFFRTDVSDADQRAAMIASVVSCFGPLESLEEGNRDRTLDVCL